MYLEIINGQVTETYPMARKSGYPIALLSQQCGVFDEAAVARLKTK